MNHNHFPNLGKTSIPLESSYLKFLSVALTISLCNVRNVAAWSDTS